MGDRVGAYRVSVGRLERKRPLGDLGVDGRIILKWILQVLHLLVSPKFYIYLYPALLIKLGHNVMTYFLAQFILELTGTLRTLCKDNFVFHIYLNLC